MNITSVNYTRTFNLGNYSSEKIGVEMALNPGEDAKEALEQCRLLTEEYHKENVKRLTELGYYYQQEEQEEVVITNKKSSKDTAKEFIMASKTIEELKSWEIMSKNNKELAEVYDTRMNQLK